MNGEIKSLVIRSHRRNTSSFHLHICVNVDDGVSLRGRSGKHILPLGLLPSILRVHPHHALITGSESEKERE